MIPLTNYDYSEGEQWGRYNLPRSIWFVFLSLSLSFSIDGKKQITLW